MASADSSPESSGLDRSAPAGRSGADIVRFWGVYAGCLGLLLFRGWDRISHPQLFAEDLRFVGQALNDGWFSLLQPYDFFFHSIPRLIAILSVELVPVSHIPLFTNLACYALTAAAMANVSRSAYAWLIPSNNGRVALSLLLPLAPGLIETLGNIAGIHWSLLFWLAALCLRDPDQPFKIWELVLAALISVTVAAAIVFVPIAFLRLVFAWRRKTAPAGEHATAAKVLRYEFVFFMILFAVSAFLLLNFVFSDEKVGTEKHDIVARMRSIEALLGRLHSLFTAFYFLHPILGTHHTSLFFRASPVYPLFAVALLVIGLLLWRLKHQLDERFWLVPVWLGCLFLLAIMLSFVRYWSFYGIFSPPYWDWWFRYNFIFATTAMLFWFILLRPKELFNPRLWRSATTLALITAYVLQADTKTLRARPPHQKDGFAIERYGDTDYWSRTSSDLERSINSGCPREIAVRGHPKGRWKFIYRSPIQTEDCKEN